MKRNDRNNKEKTGKMTEISFQQDFLMLLYLSYVTLTANLFLGYATTRTIYAN